MKNIFCLLGFHGKETITNEFIGVGSTLYLYSGNTVRWFFLTAKCSRCGKEMRAYSYYNGTPKESLPPDEVGRELMADSFTKEGDKDGMTMDYTKIINLLLESIIGQTGWGRSVATVELQKIVSHDAEIVIDRLFKVNPSDQTTLMDCLRGIYDPCLEKLANQWVNSGGDNLMMSGLYYLVSVDSQYAESCIKRMQTDSELHNRDRAGIAAATLLKVRLAKENYEIKE